MFLGYVAQSKGMVQEQEAWWRRAAAASINELAILLQEAQAQETTLLDSMSQMGRALQHLSTDAALSEALRKYQERSMANLQAYAGNLPSAGAELKRQHQLTMQQAEAKIQQMLHDASLRFAVSGRR